MTMWSGSKKFSAANVMESRYFANMEKIFDWKQYPELRTQMDFMKNYHSNEIYLSLLGGKIIFPLITMGSESGSKKISNQVFPKSKSMHSVNK